MRSCVLIHCKLVIMINYVLVFEELQNVLIFWQVQFPPKVGSVFARGVIETIENLLVAKT